MSYATRRIARSLAATLALSSLAAAPAFAGPPWISIELPANPLDPTTRGAFLLVHTFHHDKTVRMLVEGRAEGLVDGQRKRIELDFDRTSRDGVLALRQSWPREGNWVLVITLEPHSAGGATALVGIDDGEVRSIRVPTQTKDERTWPRQVTPQDIDGALRQLAADDAPATPKTLGLVGSALLLPFGLVALRRRGR
jgi:hypothetical protein